MGVNKVTYAGETLIDLTEDTVTPEKLFLGETAHDKSGEVITGTYQAPSAGSQVFVIKNAKFTRVSNTVQYFSIRPYYEGYQNLPPGSVIVELTQSRINSSAAWRNITHDYDRTTGLITITASGATFGTTAANTETANIYIIPAAVITQIG